MSDGDVIEVPESPSPPRTVDWRRELRQRWELASVLNFLHVFEPVMKTKLNLSAEVIETGLVEFNDSVSQLHIALLKGITPGSKLLNGSDAWVTVLSKKLKEWWPWVAQGDFPLSTVKGEELPRYKELDPTIRLLILKALCELRAIQDDIIFYINESIKGETAVSTFRKEKLGEDENGTTYWYDGSEITGHRLYREVHQLKNNPNVRGKEAKLETFSQWETVATDLEEFRQVVDEFSHSKVRLEVAVGNRMKLDAIPALEKLEKKKQRELRNLKQQDTPLYPSQTSRFTRSSHNSRPVNYTYDEYDRAITEAIKEIQKRKKFGQKHGRGGTVSTERSDEVTDSGDGTSIESDVDIDSDADDTSDYEYEDGNEEVGDENKASHADEESKSFNKRGQKEWPAHHIPRGPRYSKRLAGTDADHNSPENTNLSSKNRLWQRPSVNTAVEYTIISDSEEDNSQDGARG